MFWGAVLCVVGWLAESLTLLNKANSTFLLFVTTKNCPMSLGGQNHSSWELWFAFSTDSHTNNAETIMGKTVGTSAPIGTDACHLRNNRNVSYKITVTIKEIKWKNNGYNGHYLTSPLSTQVPQNTPPALPSPSPQRTNEIMSTVDV